MYWPTRHILAVSSIITSGVALIRDSSLPTASSVRVAVALHLGPVWSSFLAKVVAHDDEDRDENPGLGLG